MIVEERGFVLRRNWAILAVSAIVFAFGVLLAELGAHDSVVLGLLLAYFGGVCAPLFYWRNAFPHARPAMIRASAAGVQVDQAPEIRAEDIIEARIITRRGDAIVDLAVRDQPPLVLRMPTAEAKALVDLVGVRRTRFRLIASYGKRFLVCFGLCALLSLVNVRGPELFVIALPGLALWGAIFAWLLGFLRGRLVVGADGFTVRWAFRSRFIAFRDVVSVQGRPRRGDARTPDTIVTLASGNVYSMCFAFGF